MSVTHEQRGYYDRLWGDVGADSLSDHERARLEINARLLTKHVATSEGRKPTIREVDCGCGWLSGLLLQGKCPQPIEQWFLPAQLAELVALHCHTIRHTTAFVPWDHASRIGRAMIGLDRRLGRLGPGEIVAGLGGSLYSVLLARRAAP